MERRRRYRLFGILLILALIQQSSDRRYVEEPLIKESTQLLVGNHHTLTDNYDFLFFVFSQNSNLKAKAWRSPATTWDAGTRGTYIKDITIDVSITGYNPIVCCIRNLNHTTYVPVAFLNSSQKVVISLFRTTASAESIPKGSILVAVLYAKNISVEAADN